MVSEKKPSIYADRGTIGSADELDEYGVWVKSEPQDLSPSGGMTKETFDASGADDLDFAIPEMEDLPDFDSLGDEAFDDNAGEGDPDLPEIEETEEDTDNFSEQADDIEFTDFPEDETGEALELPDFSDADEGEAGDFTEVSMDDFIGTADTDTEPAPEVPSKQETVVKPSSESRDLSTRLLMKIADELSSIRSELGGLKKEFSVIKASAPSQTDVEGGFFGEEDDEKIALTGDELNNILNTADFTEESGSDATIELADDLDIQEAENSLDFSSESLAEKTGGDIKTSRRSDLPGTKRTDEEDETLSIMDLDTSLEETNLDELEGEIELDDSADQSLEPQSFDVSFEDDIVPLQEEALELSDDTPGDSEEIILEDLPDDTSGEVVLEDLPDDILGGSEEIILDDLPDDTSGELVLEDLPEDTLGDSEDVLELSDDTLGDSEEVLELADEMLDISGDAIPGFSDEAADELKQLRESGAEPMAFAPAPEDAEYLAEDPLAQEQDDEILAENNFDETLDLSLSDDESLDLSGAVIDEPDFSSEIQDAPPEEPFLEDISIDLDMDEDVPAEKDEGELNLEDIAGLEEEIQLPPDDTISSGDDDLVFPETESAEEGGDLSLIPEGFVVGADDSQSALEELEESEEEIISEDDLGILDGDIDAEDKAPETKEEKTESVSVPSEINRDNGKIPTQLKQELKTVLSYMDQLLESLPDDKIEEFAKSEYYDTYKKLFKELGLV